jgi:hypothetical protein
MLARLDMLNDLKVNGPIQSFFCSWSACNSLATLKKISQEELAALRPLSLNRAF